MPPSKAKQAQVAARRAEMIVMKVQGRSAVQIANHFGIDPATARSDLSRAIKKAKELEVENADLYRFIQGQRLETLLRGVWPEAVDGDIKAGEQARKYIADLTDLFGLRIPVRTEISGPDGGAIPFGGNDLAELSALIDIADQDHALIPQVRDDQDDEDEALEADGEDADGDDD